MHFTFIFLLKEKENKINMNTNKTATNMECNLFWPTTSELGACPALWFIYPVPLSWVGENEFFSHSHYHFPISFWIHKDKDFPHKFKPEKLPAWKREVGTETQPYLRRCLKLGILFKTNLIHLQEMVATGDQYGKLS